MDTAIKLTTKVTKDDRQKQTKLQDLLILLTSTFVSTEELNKIWEASMTRWDENPAVIMLEDRGKSIGRNQEKISIATNMLRKGFDIQDVSEVTGLSEDAVSELQDGLLLAN